MFHPSTTLARCGEYSEYSLLAAAAQDALDDEIALAAEERAMQLVTLDEVEGEIADLGVERRNILFQFIAMGRAAEAGQVFCDIYNQLIREKADAVLRGDVQ